MAKPRMDLTAFVGKLLEEQDGDVLGGRDSRAVAGVDGERSRRLDRRRASRAHRRAHGVSHGTRTRMWDTRLARSRIGHPQGAAGDVFPVAPAAAPACRACIARGGPRSVCAWRLDVEGRRPREGARSRRNFQVRGVSHLCRARSRGCPRFARAPSRPRIAI